MCRTVLHDLSVLAVHDNAKSIADQWKLLYIFGRKWTSLICRNQTMHNSFG